MRSGTTKGSTVKVYLDFCDYTVEINFVESPEVFRNEVLAKKFPLLGLRDSDFVACHTSDNRYPFISWITLPKPCPISLAVHEIIHATDHIMKVHGFKGTEFRAYVTQHILEQALKLKGVFD